MTTQGKGVTVNIGGVPVDLNSGMIEAVTNPPAGFASKHEFTQTDLVSRINSIRWFAHCGEPLALDLSMATQAITNWPQAIESCKSTAWENVELEAQNQLTLWLHLHDHDNYRQWNDIANAQKKAVVNPSIEGHVAPFQSQHRLDIALVHCVQWDMLGALMENAYLSSGHSAFFFLELLMVYESGHFPCGWLGEWPQGKLLVY
jgi:hypothetical protein